MNDRNRKNKAPLSPGKIIGLMVVLFALPGELTALLIFFGIIGFMVYLGIKSAKGGKAPQHSQHSQRSKQEVFDDCPKPICFHKDKGEHHVRRGKEIDPWDRPDIDIRKYQRNH